MGRVMLLNAFRLYYFATSPEKSWTCPLIWDLRECPHNFRIASAALSSNLPVTTKDRLTRPRFRHIVWRMFCGPSASLSPKRCLPFVGRHLCSAELFFRQIHDRTIPPNVSCQNLKVAFCGSGKCGSFGQSMSFNSLKCFWHFWNCTLLCFAIQADRCFVQFYFVHTSQIKSEMSG